MTSSAPGRLAAPMAPMRVFPSGIDRPLLYQILSAVLPAWGLVALGRPRMGAAWYFAALGLLILWNGIHKSPERISAVLLGTLPAMSEFRSLLFYNGAQLIFLAAFLIWYEFRRRETQRVIRDKALIGFMAFTVIYWLISWYSTGEYAANFRAMDASMSAASVLLLYRVVKLFRTAMLGLGICVVGEGTAFLGHGGRLGTGEFGEVSLANPIVFGVPAALLFLLSIVHGGRLMQLKDSPVLRYSLAAAAGVGLLLSTSRGSWLIALAGLTVIFAFDRAQRPAIFAMAALLALATLALLQTERGAVLDQYLAKTFDAELSLDKRTTGRLAQWEVFPAIMAASPVWGHGPGLSRYVVGEYTGRVLALHSLILHMGVELGLIGLVLMVWFLATVGIRSWTMASRFGEPVPLMAFAGFLAMTVSVTGLDLAGGAYLGLAMLPAHGRLWAVREAILTPVEQVRSGVWQGEEFPELPRG
jgi:O-antigen ligase